MKYPNTEEIKTEFKGIKKERIWVVVILLGIAIITVLFQQWPLVMKLMFQNYLADNNMMITIAMIEGFIILIMVFLLLMIYSWAGGPVWAWCKSRIMNKPILIEWSLDNQFKFRVPKSITPNAWELSDKEACQVRRNAIGTAAHRTPAMLAIPEIGAGISPQDVVENQQINPNFSLLRLYGKAHEIKGIEKTLSNVYGNDLKQWFPVLLVAAMIVMLLGPYAYKQLNTISNERQLQNELILCTTRQGAYAQVEYNLTVPTVSKAPVSKTGGSIS